MLRALLFFLLFSNTTLLALNKSVELNISAVNEHIVDIKMDLKNNIWLIGYENYNTYQDLIQELDIVDNSIQKLSIRRDQDSKEELKNILKEQDRLEKQIELLTEYKNSPFLKIIKPSELAIKPEIDNPLSVVTAYSYIKQIEQDRKNYKNKIDSLKYLIDKLKEQDELLKEIYILQPIPINEERFFIISQDILAFTSAYELAKTTYDVYSKKVDRVRLEVSDSIAIQVKRAFNIGIFILVVIGISFIFKFIIKKYIKDNERFYMANKAINLINFTLIVLILLFSYIENVSYFVTVLGFASAGIAIAMKDWFMSILGWMVIVFGGSFHVGDRVKVQKDGLPYVGDIIDISLLRITILEDITLTSYMHNRRAGRVVFIPNNYVFTTLIANYTHGTSRTVWDGIDITISFDSNHKKAINLIKEITKKYSKGYTNIARRGLNQLRHQYSLKNTNVEPRIFSFLEPHGLTISTWYMTNSYGTLMLRSTISADILDTINKEDDIKIAYPTQTVDILHSTKRV
ncbi:MAG: mechanosensitive ion channel, partial [Sulfurospirillum sp.]|nr:mechanosensitive ion channel [Sulfurospirillum sp.]